MTTSRRRRGSCSGSRPPRWLPAVGALTVTAAADGWFVYLCSEGLFRVREDGSDPRTVISWSNWGTCGAARGVAVDSATGVVVWTCNADKKVYRAGLEDPSPTAVALDGLSASAGLHKDGVAWNAGKPIVAAHNSRKGGWMVDYFDPTPPGKDTDMYLRKKAGFPDGGGLAVLAGTVWLSWSDGTRGAGVAKSDGAQGDTDLSAFKDYWDQGGHTGGDHMGHVVAGTDGKLYLPVISQGSTKLCRVDPAGGTVEDISVSVPPFESTGVPEFNTINGQRQPAFAVINTPPDVVFAEGSAIKIQPADGGAAPSTLYTAPHTVGPITYYVPPALPTAPPSAAPSGATGPPSAPPSASPVGPTMSPILGGTPTAPPASPSASPDAAAKSPPSEGPSASPLSGNDTAAPTNVQNVSTAAPSAPSNATENSTEAPSMPQNSTEAPSVPQNSTEDIAPAEEEGDPTLVLVIAGAGCLLCCCGMLAMWYVHRRWPKPPPTPESYDRSQLVDLVAADPDGDSPIGSPAVVPVGSFVVRDLDLSISPTARRPATEVASPRTAPLPTPSGRQDSPAGHAAPRPPAASPRAYRPISGRSQTECLSTLHSPQLRGGRGHASPSTARGRGDATAGRRAVNSSFSPSGAAGRAIRRVGSHELATTTVRRPLRSGVA